MQLDDTDTDRPSIETRLATLERKHSRLRLAAIAALTLATCSIHLPNAIVRRVLASGDSIEAQAFILRAAEGRERAALRLTRDGTPSLTLDDANETTRVSLAVDTASAGRLDLADETGKSRASFSATPHGAPFLAFVDQHDALRAGLTLQADGSPAFLLMDSAGKGRAAMAVTADGSPTICVVDRDHPECRPVQPVADGAPEQNAGDHPSDSFVTSRRE